jgi:Xaa-Pro aminopeptidase
MIRANERITLVRRELEEAGFEGLVCGLPSNVLLLTGYWPVVGTAVAIVNRAGRVGLIVPEDERRLAERGWADEVHLLRSESLSDPRDARELLRGPLAESVRGLGSGSVGVETGPAFQPSSYVSFNLYGESLREELCSALPGASVRSADESLGRLRSVLTADERSQVRLACRLASQAFSDGAAHVGAGKTEAEVAEGFRSRLATGGAVCPGVRRAGGFVFCMSGPNSALACGSHAWSTGRGVERGDFLLVHCNSYVDGYWTDITRTYCMGEPDPGRQRMYEAVFAARQAALDAIRPGARASAVDAAARGMLDAQGFGNRFKHSTGHGVGFAAIDHNARPRLRPGSSDVLEAGMVCNVEPAIYLEGIGGVRHCDMVEVTGAGAEVLTPFQTSLERLVLGVG